MRQSRRIRVVAAATAALVASQVGAAVADSTPYPPGAPLPGRVTSPPVAADAPFTPTVNKLLQQLLPSDPPTPQQLQNAALLMHGIASVPLSSPTSRCGTIGSNDAPAGTTPSIAPLCWTDAQGVNVEGGAQVRQTTAPPNRTAMASSWDPRLLNAWGQVEGSEGRAFGITGIYAPQSDLIRVPDWGRNLTVFSEDPLLAGTLAAAEVNGVQGKGLMAQVKHVAFYDGQFQAYDARVQDQAAHQLFLTPYEYAMTGSGVLPHPGNAASAMCSYARFELVQTPGQAGSPPAEASPGGSLACDHPFMNRIAHDEWKWPGFFASDYDFAMDSTAQSMNAGNDQEMPTNIFFGDPLVAAVESGAVPLDTFKLALARILYQEERFHLLGHPNDDTDYLSRSSPANPATPLPLPHVLKNAHAAVTERAAEEGAVLLKNSRAALPLSRRDLRRGVLVVGESAEYMPADPGPEQADGYPDRDAISPLEQLRQFAPRGARITYLPYMPGTDPEVGDGRVVPPAALVSKAGKRGAGLTRAAGPGAGHVDRGIDFTYGSRQGQLAFNRSYTWHGAIQVTRSDDYTFQFQFSVPRYAMQQPTGNAPGNIVPPSCTGPGAPTFSLQTSNKGQQSQALTSTPPTLATIQTNPTASGYIERGLANCLVHVGTLAPGRYPLTISWKTPKAFARDRFSMREPGSRRPSLRFAWSRSAADRAHALQVAAHASKVVVFADCTCVSENTLMTPAAVNSFDPGPTQLITQIAKANPHTVVVSNAIVATLMPWLAKVRSVLQMWYPGSEGGTATARLLLGKAVPGGHLTSTWPKAAGDTIYAYPETVPLYSGDTTGVHSERFDNKGATVDWTEGIFTGYRFFDREHLAPLFPFGYGLSYTTFRYSHVATHTSGAGVDVSFDVANTGRRTGATVPQVYVGPAPNVPAGVQQADRTLAGFDHIVIQPGRTKHEVIHLGPGADKAGYGDRRAFEYWDSARQSFVTAPGRRTVWVGAADSAAQLLTTSSGPVSAGSNVWYVSRAIGRPGGTGGQPALPETALVLALSAAAMRRRRLSTANGLRPQHADS